MIADQLDCVHANWKQDSAATVRDVFTRMHDELRIDEVLNLIDPDPDRLARLHVVFVPDGPLSRLPLHAACSRRGHYLYQRVASVRYAVAMRTMQLQKESDNSEQAVSSQADPLRGIVFAWPDRAGNFLPGVIEEVGVLLEETSPDNWRIYGERGEVEHLANRSTFRRWHRSGNLGWLVAHGTRAARDQFSLADGRSVHVYQPGLLLGDGWVSMSRLVAEGYNFSSWRLLHTSACLLGRLEAVGTSKELLGFIATLTMLRCRRVVSAMWELNDEAAVEFARHWIRALNRNVFGSETARPHSFSTALKEAITEFRHARNGQFDHEVYWAPYILYGLG